jgi:primosomal protein N' (replication factor Y)
MPLTAQVLIPLALPKAFSYAIPENMSVTEGAYVQVSIGNKPYIGVVWRIENTGNTVDTEEQTTKKYTLKPIEKALKTPPMHKTQRMFIDWVARYTISYPGMVLKMAMGMKDLFKPAKPIEVYQLKNNATKIRLTPARTHVIDYLKAHHRADMATLLTQTQASISVIRGLVKAEILEKTQADLDSTAPAGMRHSLHSSTLATLDDAQQRAASTIIVAMDSQSFSPLLLDGVTGSGKTEVFFAAIAHILAQEKGQALILLPEIALTTQMIDRIRKRFGFEPTQWHSGLTPTTRRKNWHAIAQGHARLVIGARSALFLPFQDLKLVVVDEEHDSSYKQEEGVIYHARDMAVMYASLLKIPIVLASATPALETMLNVKDGKYQHMILPARYGGATMPHIHVIDMRKSGLNKQQWISPKLQEAIGSAMSAGNQSLLFINRRGYAPLMLCRNCGYRFACKSCSSWLVAHKSDRKLHCHHCGYHELLPKECPECASEEDFAACGPGVERIAEEVAARMPEATIQLLTSDHLTTPAKTEEALERITSGKVDVIVGTQLIAKGHHFPKLTLVGVIDADLGLAGGDLRAAERTFQLLHQVSGRAGREQQQGHVYLQSYIPDNAVIQALQKGDRDAFLYAEEQSRQFTQSPPFIRYTALVISGKEELAVKRAASQVGVWLKEALEADILGPVPAAMALLKGKYRYRLLVKSARHAKIHAKLLQLHQHAQKFRGIDIRIDVDPHSFM